MRATDKVNDRPIATPAGYGHLVPQARRLRLSCRQLSLFQRLPRFPIHRRRSAGDRPERPCSLVQFTLPMVASSATVTPLMQQLEGILTRIAQNRGEMPNNPTLGQRAGGRGRSSVDRALRRLAGIGRIRIETVSSRRRVHIVSQKMSTDWGEARPGHAPFCSRPRKLLSESAKATDPKDELPVEDEAQLPRLTGAVTLPPLPSLQGHAWTAPAVATGPSARCQWPLWGDDEHPTNRYCDAPAVSGCSWCGDHAPLARAPRRARACGQPGESARPRR